MVNIKEVEASIFINLGFKTKIQAMNTYKGIKSLPRETIDAYLERTYNQIKHVIYSNQIDDLVQNELVDRRTIECESFHRSFEIQMNWKKRDCKPNTNTLQSEYDKLLFKYRTLYKEFEDVEEINEILQNKLSFLELMKSIHTTKIMDLHTRRINQCYECSICNDVIGKRDTIYDICHIFHIRCITLWLLDNIECPCCRKEII